MGAWVTRLTVEWHVPNTGRVLCYFPTQREKSPGGLVMSALQSNVRNFEFEEFDRASSKTYCAMLLFWYNDTRTVEWEGPIWAAYKQAKQTGA